MKRDPPENEAPINISECLKQKSFSTGDLMMPEE